MRLPSLFHAPAAALLAWSALTGHVAAQVQTDCFPMNKTCPPNPGFGMDVNFNFNTTPNLQIWEVQPGPVTWDAENGAGFRISELGQSPTIRSTFYYFWGRTEVHLKAAKGTGVISSIMMLSDNLDEIDWEFFGGNASVAQSNYFGKGHFPEVSAAGYHNVPGGVQDDFRNYTIDWTKDYLDFYIDDDKVRRVVPQEANNSYYYPQTPMRLFIGIWAGGDPRMPEGTREWAGGDTDYSQGPFDMYVKSAHVTDYSSGRQYEYTDRSGSWESIKIHEGNSTVHDIINAPPEKSLADRWNELPNGAKIAIYAGASGFVGLLVVMGLFYCIRQRRRGAREARAAEARAEAERLELERFKKAGVDPDSFTSSATEYNAKEMRRDGVTDHDSYSVPPSPSLNAITPASPLDGTDTNTHAAATAAAAAGVGAGAAAAAGMHSPTRAQSPRIASPAPGGFYSDRQGNNRSPAPSLGGQSMRSPTHPQPMAHPQPQRSFTTDGYGAEENDGWDYGQGGGNGGYMSVAGGSGGGGGGYGQGGGNQGYWGNSGGGGYR